MCLSTLPVARTCVANEPPQNSLDMTIMPLRDHYLLLFCLPDGAAEAFGRHGWATGMDDGGASLRSEGGSATSRYRTAMAEPPDRRLRATEACHSSFCPKIRSYRMTTTNSRNMSI